MSGDKQTEKIQEPAAPIKIDPALVAYFAKQQEEAIAKALAQAAKASIQKSQEKIKLKRISFGNKTLEVFPPSKNTFNRPQNVTLSEQQGCLVDNLWIAYKKNDGKHMVASISALCHHFHQSTRNFKCYVVAKGTAPGVYADWTDVHQAMEGYPKPFFKGFNRYDEAFDFARANIGADFYVDYSLRNIPHEPHDYTRVLCSSCAENKETLAKMQTQVDKVQKEKKELANNINELEILVKKLKSLVSSPYQVDPAAGADPSEAYKVSDSEKETNPISKRAEKRLNEKQAQAETSKRGRLE